MSLELTALMNIILYMGSKYGWISFPVRILVVRMVRTGAPNLFTVRVH
jgi:hypothetical protein